MSTNREMKNHQVDSYRLELILIIDLYLGLVWILKLCQNLIKDINLFYAL